MMNDGTAVRRETFLSFSPPCIGEEEIQEVVDTLRSDWISTGPKTRAFESEIAAYLNAPAVLALNSCTAGLHTALVTAGVGPGHEVITTTNTFAASANVIEHVGARPVLVDVEPDTLNISPAAVREAVTPRTRAIIPVHFAGHPVDLDAIHEIARERDLLVVEDAAHAFSAKYKGRHIGSGENPVSFSFYATKNLTTGEGGALTGTPEFLERARLISLHGMNRDAWTRAEKGGSWYYEVLLPGFKYNMTDIQAALGLHQLRKLARFQARRTEIAAQYNGAFGAEPALQIPAERAEITHAWQLYTLRLRLERLRLDRDEFIEELTRRNIGTSVHFIPVHMHPFYRDKYGYRAEDLPVAHESYHRILSLPLHPHLSDKDVTHVIEGVLEIVRQHEE